MSLIDHANKLNRDDETISRLAILTSILEPLLINDLNLERALELNTIEILVNLLELPSHLKDLDKKADPFSIKLPMYIKYAIRCVTSCVRHPNGINQLFDLDHGTNHILAFIKTIRDEEIIANSAKIVRIILRQDNCYDRMISKHTDLGNILLETIPLFQFSEVVLTEIIAALRNFCRSTQACSFVATNMIYLLVELSMNASN